MTSKCHLKNAGACWRGGEINLNDCGTRTIRFEAVEITLTAQPGGIVDSLLSAASYQ